MGLAAVQARARGGVHRGGGRRPLRAADPQGRRGRLRPPGRRGPGAHRAPAPPGRHRHLRGGQRGRHAGPDGAGGRHRHPHRPRATYILASAPASTLANWLEMAGRRAGGVRQRGDGGGVPLGGRRGRRRRRPHPPLGGERAVAVPEQPHHRRPRRAATSAATPGCWPRPPSWPSPAPPRTATTSRPPASGWPGATPSTSRTGTTAPGGCATRRTSRWPASPPTPRGPSPSPGRRGRLAHGRSARWCSASPGAAGAGAPGAEYATDAEVAAALAAHTALPNAHHAQAHDHTSGGRLRGADQRRARRLLPVRQPGRRPQPPRPPTASGCTPRTTARGWPPSTTSPRAGTSTRCPP